MAEQIRIDAKKDVYNGAIFTEDWKISAQNASFLQRGNFTLSAGAAAITLPRNYLSAQKAGQNITFIVTAQSNNHVFINGIMSAQAFGTANISTISGFYISGSGTDTGYWLTIGYK